jgi:nickel-dependent lactate racemase
MCALGGFIAFGQGWNLCQRFSVAFYMAKSEDKQRHFLMYQPWHRQWYEEKAVEQSASQIGRERKVKGELDNGIASGRLEERLEELLEAVCMSKLMLENS